MSKSKNKSSTGNAASPAAKPVAAKTGSSDSQLAAFEKAMSLFHSRDFRNALPLFEDAAKGNEVSLSHSAQLHARMCRQRLETETPQLDTSEDNYAFGLALAHRRELGGAEEYLQRALQLAPRADHILYTLALVKGLQGDVSSAAGFLSRAIEIQPSNRMAARTDPEFHELLRHQPIRDLVF